MARCRPDRGHDRGQPRARLPGLPASLRVRGGNDAHFDSSRAAASRRYAAAFRSGFFDSSGGAGWRRPFWNRQRMTLYHYLALSGIVFSIGIYGVLTRRNVLGILMSIELM